MPLTPEQRWAVGRLLVLVALLAGVIGAALGYHYLTVAEVTGQVVQGLVALLFAGTVRR